MKKIVAAAIFFGLLFFAGILFAEEAGQDKEEAVRPRKVSVDANYDGKVDKTELYDKSGSIKTVELDRNGDSKVDEWITYENGKPVKAARDTNADGLPDVWVEY